MDLSGQWLGFSNGEPVGRVVADIEKRDGIQRVWAYLFPKQAGLPATVGIFEIEDEKDEFSVKGEIAPFLPQTGLVLNEADLAQILPGVEHSREASFDVHIASSSKILVSWKTPVGTHGTVELVRSDPGSHSKLAADTSVKSWDDFRRKVSQFPFSEYIFRGQRNPYPLQTSFHRTKRKNLHFYLQNDVPALHRSLTGKTDHLFDLDRPQQMGAFLNLAQHHGFPTPLLDWTYSPFVAAWFAYREVVDKGEVKNQDEVIRIFCLNKKVFSRFSQFQNLTYSPPHLSILEALAIENSRAIPQQGLLTLTNVHDIERHVMELAKDAGEPFLTAFDLPKAEAPQAINELAMMGITRSTMFPSVESICLDMRDRLY